MDIQILSFTPHAQGGEMLGIVVLTCDNMDMTLRVCHYNNHVYVQMPILKRFGTILGIRWSTREISDNFQREVLKALMLKYSEHLQVKKNVDANDVSKVV